MRNQVKTNISLTEDQEEAVGEIKKELFRGSGVATLSGYAGTGKTTLLNTIVNELESDVNETYLMAPTHKAAEVLSRKTGRDVITVHSAFGLRPFPDGEGGYVFKKKDNVESMNFFYKSLVAVDEASMINTKLYNLLMKVKKQYNLKVLFCGDPAQLPPVNHSKSPTFDHDGYMLTDIIRQADENPVLEASMRVRKNGAKWDFEENVSNTGEGVYVLNDLEGFFDSALNDFDSDRYRRTGDFARVLAYKNETVNSYNKFFRSKLYENNHLQFVEGEWLIVMEPWTPIGSVNDYDPIIQNSEEIVVRNRDITKVDGWFVWDLEVSSSLSSNDKRRIKVLHESEREKFNRRLEHLKKKAKEESYRWPEYYDLKEKFAKVDYSFSLTTHKAQGSTFQRVYMDLCDLRSCHKIKDRDSLVYVATTRPSHRLYVLNQY